jgi:hypothetical protein
MIPINVVDPTKSTSFALAVNGSNRFSTAFGNGSEGISGDFITDTVQLGGATLTNLTMGLGKKGNMPIGLLGLGYSDREFVVGVEGPAGIYDNFPVALAKSGQVSTTAFSLWLNDQSKDNLQPLVAQLLYQSRY